LPDARAVLDAANAPAGTEQSDGLTARLAGIPESEQRRTLLDLVRTHVAALLGYDDPGAIAGQRGFDDLGFDSVAAVDLRTRLTAATGKTLPTSMIYDHPTPDALAAHLWNELCAQGGADGELPVLAQLDRLERTADGLAPEEIESTRITTRLRSLLARLTDALATSGENGAVGDQLETASADDVFAFIDNELGLS
ncbi:phosphopantetheine-binding protein, partial [Streptomyces carpinensis]